MHSHHHHREHQVSHRRVHHILKHEPAGAKKHNDSGAFSKVTSKTAAEHHDHVHGHKGHKRHARGGKITGKPSDMKHIASELKEHERKEHGYARGGRTKGHKGQQTNIAIVMPHKGQPAGGAPVPPGAAGPGGPPLPLPGGPPAGPPGMPPPGMPMRARGGRAPHIAGEATEGNIKAWGKRASGNSYFRGGAATGVGREEKAHRAKRRK